MRVIASPGWRCAVHCTTCAHTLDKLYNTIQALIVAESSRAHKIKKRMRWNTRCMSRTDFPVGRAEQRRESSRRISLHANCIRTRFIPNLTASHTCSTMNRYHVSRHETSATHIMQRGHTQDSETTCPKIGGVVSGEHKMRETGTTTTPMEDKLYQHSPFFLSVSAGACVALSLTQAQLLSRAVQSLSITQSL